MNFEDSPMRIEVTIDRLVAHGIDAADAAQIQRGIEQSLSEILPAWSSTTSRAESSRRIDTRVGGSAHETGAEIGTAIGRALGVHQREDR